MTKDTNGDGTMERYGYAFASIPEGGQLTDYWMLFVYSWGADLLDGNFKPAFNNPKGVEATQYMADLLHKYKVVPPGVLTYGIPQAFDAFKKGITAMTTQWGYALASVEDPNESAVAGNAAYAVPPSKARLGARFAQWAYTIPTNARDPQASWEFIKLASSLESQIALLPEVPRNINKTTDSQYIGS
ncbi:MAG: extracellular solute-binding protein [Bacteroidia bacterium]|nr:extracellular solute-binding protein [Bacteroidia bacterium]